ncbi:hypothetical protein GQ600_27619 [Phytophthora cactorum]|nr:hypothetical protein GQ600_27619 [Phytophthora cactorum]
MIPQTKKRETKCHQVEISFQEAVEPCQGEATIAAGKKVDITKLKTPSGKTVDLTKVKLKTTPVKEADISKMKKLAEQDPDLRSIGSVVGKSPTQLSAKQVTDVQSFIRKHLKKGSTSLIRCSSARLAFSFCSWRQVSSSWLLLRYDGLG